MIKKLVYDGNQKNINEHKGIQAVLSKIDNENTEYFVGVDLAKKDSSDFSIITKYKQNLDGTFAYYGTELV